MLDPQKITEALHKLNCVNSRNLNEIKLAYKKLAIKFHPDSNSSPEANKKFKELTSAYALLEKYARDGGSFPFKARPQPKPRPTPQTGQPWPPPPPPERPGRKQQRVHVPPGYLQPGEPQPVLYAPYTEHQRQSYILSKLYEGEIIKHSHQSGAGAIQNSSMGGYSSGVFLQSEVDMDTALDIFNRIFQETSHMSPQAPRNMQGQNYTGNNLLALPMRQRPQPPQEPFPFIRRMP